MLYIKSVTRLKEDVAMGIVLSVFFGGGRSIRAHSTNGWPLCRFGDLYLRQDRLDGSQRRLVDRRIGRPLSRDVLAIVQGTATSLF